MDEGIKISFPEDSDIKGLSIILNGDGAVADLFGSTYPLTNKAVEKLSTFSDAYNAIKNVRPTLQKRDGDVDIYLYLLDGREFRVYYNAGLGVITAIEEGGMYMEITGE